jgi:hypothetical protein
MDSENHRTATKQRHGCLTAYLTLLLVANMATAIIYLSSLSTDAPQRLPKSMILILGISTVLNMVFAVALFKWKKWGFYGFIGTTIIAGIVNLSLGIGPLSLLGFSGIPILYGILRIGNERAGWHQLD